MYAHCIRSWRLLGHSRHSPLSLLRGFALEPLKVLFVCTRTASVRSARTAVEGTRSNLGCGSSSTLGFLQRSLVVTLPFVPWRRIYWRYVVEPVDVAMLCECLCLSQPAQFPVDPTREMLCHIHKRMLLCVIMSCSLISLLPTTADKSCVGLFERPEECKSNGKHNLKQGSMSQRWKWWEGIERRLLAAALKLALHLCQG